MFTDSLKRNFSLCEVISYQTTWSNSTDVVTGECSLQQQTLIGAQYDNQQ